MYVKNLMITLVIVGLTQTTDGDEKQVVPLKELYLDTPHSSCDENRELRKVDCSRRGFDSVPQNLPEDIKGLNLWFNNITSLLSSSFRRYTLITELNLSYNNITRIENTTFYPLKDLKYLDMGQNVNLAFPSAGLFRWATKLSYLLVSSSYMGSIPNDILKWSRNLDTLDLRWNRLESINLKVCGKVEHADLSYNTIENLTVKSFNFGCQTDILDLRYNPIKSVDPNVIASLDVRSLKLGNYPLTDDVLKDIFTGISSSVKPVIRVLALIDGVDFRVIPIDLCDPLRDYPLTMLDLSRNRIQDLHPFVFSNLTRLGQLNLNNNDLVTIEPTFFEGMRELRILNLNDSKVESINTNNLQWTIYLTELHLSGNSLTTINKFTFRGLQNLKILNMQSNKLLETVQLNDLKSIQKIDLSYCNIVKFELILPSFRSLSINHNFNSNMFFFPRRYFINMWFLEHLNLRHSQVWFERLYNSFKNFSVLDGLVNLKTLDLSENHKALDHPRQHLRPGVFRQLSHLESLSLKTCDLGNMDPLTFAGLESLTVLVLRNNDLHQLHVDLFKKLEQLTSIDLSFNSLVEIDQALFSNNPNLTTLMLAKNKLTRLDHNTFMPIFSSLSSIDLSSNPIVCDCDLSWLLNWLHGSLHLIQNEEFHTNCSPASLVPLRDKHLLDFDPKEFCGINVTLVCLVTFTVIFLILIIAIGYHNRWLLRYKLFLVKLAVIGYNEIRDARDHNDYEFDLNIIFYDDDEEWIREQLRPALQEQLPQFQRNIFGDNELVWGMHYLDSVDYVVSHSYKTVIVLSRVAVRDRWFMLKFRTAMDHVSDTQTEFVVVVFLEDIPDEEIPFLARLYLSDGRPYVYWPDDVRGYEYFFDELTKHLTINLRTNDLIPNE